MSDSYLSLFKHFDEMQCYDYITHPEMDQILSEQPQRARCDVADLNESELSESEQ